MLDIDMLRTFLAVAEAGSIHGGARLLHIGQPSASKLIKRLEHALKTELFVRSPQGIQLTSSGVELLDHARDIVARLDEIPSVVRRTPADPVVVKLGFTSGSSSMATLAEGVVEEIGKSRTNIKLVVREMYFDEQYSALEMGEVDIALVNPPYLGDQLKVEKLFAEPMSLWLRKDHPLSRYSHVPTAEVVQYPMVDMQGVPGYWSRFWRLADLCEGSAIHQKWPVRTLAELRYAILATGAAMPVALSALTEISTRLLTSVNLDGAPLSEIGVATSRTETRTEVLELVEKVHTVARRYIHQVEGGVLLN